MDGSTPGSARAVVIGSGIALVAGAVVLALPEAVAGFAGLVLLYALAVLAIVTGLVNLAKAARGRGPASGLVLALGLAIFAVPAALGSALTRGLGGAVLLAAGLTLVSAARRHRAARAVAR